MQQMLEVERLKIQLARENIDVPTKTLISGIVFPNRFQRHTEPGDPPTYPHEGEFLLQNPFKKAKKSKKSKKQGAGSPLRKRGKSKTDSPLKKRERGSQESLDADDDRDLFVDDV